MSFDSFRASASTVARAVAAREITAVEVAEAALAAIATRNRKINAVTVVTAARARRKAAAVDAAIARGEQPGPLAGVPYAVKNLFDIEGIVTRAGARINADNQPAQADAFVVSRLESAGAVLVGGLNMNEFAYGFTGENFHDGATLNPHDPRHITGGSSGGSAAAVAAGIVPFALGSDTNGSVRVPAALCGVFGLKPTYGRLSRRGLFPFVASFDHAGLFARSTEDLARIYDAMQSYDAEDPACVPRQTEPTLPTLSEGTRGLRIAVAGDYFRRGADPAALGAVDRIAAALAVQRGINLPQAEIARAAAYLISAAEGAALHLQRLQTRAADFDPSVRDRLAAGAMIPASVVVRAQRFRAWFQARARAIFADVDVILAPATPCRAPLIGQTMMRIDGREAPVRAELGIYTQPISFIGLPVCTVPLWTTGERLPLGVQLIGPAWREDLVLRVAQALEAAEIVAAPVAPL